MTRFAENKGKDTKDFLHTFVRYKYTVSVSIVSLKKFSKNMQDVLDSIYETNIMDYQFLESFLTLRLLHS